MEVEPITLVLLFGGEKPTRSRLPPEEVDAESRLMEALARLEEDERLDDGVEIPSDEDGLPTRYLEIEYNIEFLLNYALRVPLILTLNLN
jgi:hypothetical protein